MATRSKLTGELQKKVCDLLKVGNTVITVCDACGIGERTFHDWMEKGEVEERGPYRNFHAAVSRARANAKRMLMARIRIAAEKDWKAAAWMAERLFPKEFGEAATRHLQENAESQEFGVKFVLNTDKPLSELLNFPVAGIDPETVAQLQQDNIKFWESQVDDEKGPGEAYWKERAECTTEGQLRVKSRGGEAPANDGRAM